ncbi:hypothetical protein ScalyP_jg4172 [Parmales sp. scaly parma]|nr:hypothetical protein ScalyP_jg4172 [Parmales sp. scaly parma]
MSIRNATLEIESGFDDDETTPSLTSTADSQTRAVGASTILHKGLFRSHSFCLVGPHYLGLIFIHFFLWGASFFFAGVFESQEHTYLSAFVYVQAAITNFFLLKCGLSDPGIVVGPKTLPPEVVENQDLYRQYKYCDLCAIFQPPETAHCATCGVCIAGLDHHCPWMSKCIGEKNMPAFRYFNMSWLVLLGSVIVGVFGI